MTPAFRKGLADPLCLRWPGSASHGLDHASPAQRAKYARSDPHRQPWIRTYRWSAEPNYENPAATVLSYSYKAKLRQNV